MPNNLPVIITTKETGWREMSDFPEALIVQGVNSLTNLFVLDETLQFFYFPLRKGKPKSILIELKKFKVIIIKHWN